MVAFAKHPLDIAGIRAEPLKDPFLLLKPGLRLRQPPLVFRGLLLLVPVLRVHVDKERPGPEPKPDDDHEIEEGDDAGGIHEHASP